MENPEQWNKIKELFDAALDREPGERAEFLRGACGADAELLKEIESLLSAYEKAEDFSRPAWSEQYFFEAHEQALIGPYRLIRRLGEGGMGQVWLAGQTAPVKRQVALKFIHGGTFDGSALKRFQSERQSLAIMDHPAIAKVFDAGATPEGQPYFVMEYVPGTAITEYCDQKKLKLPERLELFIRVCEGVQHAHQKAIIHRDLKPANILVVEADGKPLPRIIDFGLAKGMRPDVLGDAPATLAGSFLGTPGYMSPEQADLFTPDVDTRTDVYSLGTILYVLLSGSLPFENQPGHKEALHESLRKLREEDPPLPSTKLGMLGEAANRAAAARGTNPKQLAGLLRGDLDWITMKALERDPARRYATPSEFATDIHRYLRHEPVQARQTSASYRMRKYLRRHRVGAAATGVAGIVLVVFGLVQSVQLRRIMRARDRADRIAGFMTDMFKVSDPGEKVGNTVTAREVLDKAAGDIKTGLSKDPELQSRLMQVMGNAYLNLGLYSRAESLFDQSARVAAATLGAESLETLRARQMLAWTIFQEGRVAEAETLERKLLEQERRVLGADDPDTMIAMSHLATTLDEVGRHTDAEQIERKVLETQQRLFGSEASSTLMAMDDFAIILLHEGRLAEAEHLERQALETQRRLFGSENLTTIHYMMNEAAIKGAMGADDDCEKLLRELLQLEQRVLGPDQPETAETVYNLACLAAKHGQPNQALALLRQAIDHGFPPREDLKIGEDPDLNSLRGDQRFEALLRHAKTIADAH